METAIKAHRLFLSLLAMYWAYRLHVTQALGSTLSLFPPFPTPAFTVRQGTKAMTAHRIIGGTGLLLGINSLSQAKSRLSCTCGKR